MNKKRINLILGIALILFFIIFIFIAKYREYKLENSKSGYNIGVIYEYSKKGKAIPSFEYSYNYLGKKYTHGYSITSELGNESRDSLKTYIGKRYLIKFQFDNHKNNKLLFDCPVSDSIKPPPKGWEILPCEVTERSCLDWQCGKW